MTWVSALGHTAAEMRTLREKSTAPNAICPTCGGPAQLGEPVETRAGQRFFESLAPSQAELAALLDVVEAAQAALEFLDPYAELEPESGVAAARLTEALTSFLGASGREER